MNRLRFAVLGSAIVLVLGLAACGKDSVPLSGSVHVDGSRTVTPLTKAMAKRFMDENPGVRISVGVAGEDGGVARAEIPVVNDAVVLMVNRRNPVRCVTTEQLKQIWHGNSEVTERWSQLRDLDPPYGGPLTAWGPGTDTETFAFFTKAVNHHTGETRDYNNVLHKEELVVEYVARSLEAFGYADHPFYAARRRSVKAVAVDSGDGCVVPTPETIADGSFRPLARKLSVSVAAGALARRATKAFLQFYLDNAEAAAAAAGFIPLTAAQSAESKARLDGSPG